MSDPAQVIVEQPSYRLVFGFSNPENLDLHIPSSFPSLLCEVRNFTEGTISIQYASVLPLASSGFFLVLKSKERNLTAVYAQGAAW